MSGHVYLNRIAEILSAIRSAQGAAIASGHKPLTFISPNVGLLGQNERVFEAYARSLQARG